MASPYHEENVVKSQFRFLGLAYPGVTMVEVNRHSCVLIYRRESQNYFKSPEERGKLFRLVGGREVKA